MADTLDDSAIDRLLFVRQEVGNIVQGIKDNRLTLKEVEKFLTSTLEEAFDYDRCFNNCKSMYFCEKKENHTGKHTAFNGGLSWTDTEGFTR